LDFLGLRHENRITFSEEAWVFGGSDSELVVKAVMPDFGHVVPIIDDAVFDGVVKFEDSLFGLGFFTDVDVFIIHSDHDVFVFGFSDN
jgi:hypothetical protein